MLNYNPNVSAGGSKSKTSTGAPWRLLIISGVLFILCMVIYIGMDFGYTPYLTNEIQKVDADTLTLSKNVKDGEQKDMVRLYSQLYNISNLYETHTYPSRVFTFLEKRILPTVRIMSMDVDIQKSVIKFDAVTSDFDTVVLQVATIQGDENIKQAVLISSKKQDVKNGGGFVFSVRMEAKTGWLSTASSATTTKTQ